MGIWMCCWQLLVHVDINLLLVVLGGHIDSTGCLGARKCQGLGSSTLKKVRKVALSPLLLWKWKWE